MKIYNGYKRLNENYTLVTDDYEFKMGNGYLKTKKNDQEAVFDVFFRKIPNGGGYAVMAGIDKVIEFIENLKFDEREIRIMGRTASGVRGINLGNDLCAKRMNFVAPFARSLRQNQSYQGCVRVSGSAYMKKG